LQTLKTHGRYCLGIERDGGLQAFILRYQRTGAMGMLHVEEAYRRRGYATALVAEAARRLEEMEASCEVYIVDGNDASEALFTKLGYVREDSNAKKGTGSRRAKRKWILKTKKT
jgi:ribosomal protein S18 acetylase RimI-like enzyme